MARSTGTHLCSARGRLMRRPMRKTAKSPLMFAVRRWRLTISERDDGFAVETHPLFERRDHGWGIGQGNGFGHRDGCRRYAHDNIHRLRLGEREGAQVQHLRTAI